MADRAVPASPKPVSPTSASAGDGPGSRSFLFLAVLLAVVLGFLFRDSFNPNLALFANDGPLGLVASRVNAMPEGWWKMWSDLNWLGFDGGSRPPTWTSLSFWMLGARGFINFAPAISCLLLGLSIWGFCRSAGLRPVAGVLAGLAGALNTDFFSYACWGLPTLTMCVASVFLALAALLWKPVPLWMRACLAGAALGHALAEGFDNGAIFSLYVAAFAMAQGWIEGGTAAPAGRRIGRGVLTTALVAGSSALVAVHMLISLFQGNVSSVAGMGQDRESREARWNFITQWSLPPRETLRAVIPGLYGYRMDTEGGGRYWGTVGMDPAWDAYWEASQRDPSRRPQAGLRFSGAGHYTGVLVVVLAGFAVAQSLRRAKGAPLTDVERRWVWFWSGVAVVSLLFSFGRFAPFYRLIYALPYFNTIRNPVKFLHPLNAALVILAAYGVHALWKGWIEPGRKPSVGSPMATLRAWWPSAAVPDRRWVLGSVGAVGVALLGWVFYGAKRSNLLNHLAEVGFPGDEGAAIARFSLNEVGVFVLLLALSVGLLAVALGGWFSGGRARWAALGLGALLTLDLARANSPWIQHYNWRDRYASNPVFDTLRAQPHLARLGGRMPFGLPGQAGQALDTLRSVFDVEWHQYQFRYYDIQTFEVVQLPRPPADYTAYRLALQGNPVREWELSNTRYLLSLAPLVDTMNQQFDPGQKRFRLHTPFSLAQSPDGIIQVRTNAEGPFALVEYGGALPRAMLFDRWRSEVGDEEALRLLPSTNFQPHAEVLVSEQIPAPAVTTSSQPAGTANYRSYTPTRFLIDTEARTPCVLLVNDRHDPRWKVTVDGREEPLLRANYIMRGVYLTPGKHAVEFSYQPPTGTVWLSFATIAASLALCGYAVVLGRRSGQPS